MGQTPRSSYVHGLTRYIKCWDKIGKALQPILDESILDLGLSPSGPN